MYIYEFYVTIKLLLVIQTNFQLQLNVNKNRGDSVIYILYESHQMSWRGKVSFRLVQISKTSHLIRESKIKEIRRVIISIFRNYKNS